MVDVHQIPYEAARGDVPERYAREVATFYSPDGKHALVLFSTNEPPRTEEYETLCERIEGGWTGLSGGGGPGGGWMSTNDDASRGVSYFWDEAPPDAITAVVRSQGRDRRVPVAKGFVAFAVWDTANTVHDDIELIDFEYARPA